MGRLALITVGGNSLIKNQKHKSVEDQNRVVCETVVHIVDIVEAGTHIYHR